MIDHTTPAPFALTYDDIVSTLQNEQRIVYMRYGDGEVACMERDYKRDHYPGQNCDLHPYTPQLANALRAVLIAENDTQHYHIGWQKAASKQFPHFQAKYPNIHWCDSELIHHETLKTPTPHAMLHELMPYSTLLIGNPYLAALSFHYSHMIHTPMRNSFAYVDYIIDTAKLLIERERIRIVYLCAGMASAPIIYHLASIYDHVSFIDAGSAFDPMVGVVSRSYHHELQRNWGFKPELYTGSQRKRKL